MKFILKTRNQVSLFLSARPDPDQEISWGCPKCHVVNKTNLHSRESKCWSCGEGTFPRVHLPVTGNADETLQKIYTRRQLEHVEGEIEDLKKEIRRCEYTIEEDEERIIKLKREADEMVKMLKSK